MPILLTTPANPGENAPGMSYPRAKISRLSADLVRKRIIFDVLFGDLNEGEWITGKGINTRTFEIDGEDYNTVVGSSPGEGEKFYAGVKRLLYAWLQKNEPRFAGTVE